MRLMTYRGFVAEVGLDPGRGLYVGRLRDIRDSVHFHAPTPSALPDRMARAVDDYIAAHQEWGLPCARPFTDDRRVRFGRVGKPE